MEKPLLQEPAPEERMAKIVLAALTVHGFVVEMSMLDLAAILSPYVQLELIEAAHQERVFCLADFYNLREKLMERERASFQKTSELVAQTLQRPEARFLLKVPPAKPTRD